MGDQALESPSHSADALNLIFTVWDTAYNQNDIYQATRLSVADAWENVVKLGPAINSDYVDGSPSLSSYGLMLFFASNRPSGFGGIDLYVSVRPTLDASWGNAVNIGHQVNTQFEERTPEISANGTLLYFSSNRPGGFGLDDL